MAPATRSQRTKLQPPLAHGRASTKARGRRQTKVEHRQRQPLRDLGRPTDPSGHHCPVVKLDNGLVSMENTPEYLITAARENAVASPLLRLPAELRNAIFRYAMGGTLVIFRYSKVRRNAMDSFWHGYATHLDVRTFKKTAIGTAFHLPEVCRQIYAETATLGYATSSFFIRSTCAGTPWSSLLNLAQRSAIQSLRILSSTMYRYLMDNPNIGSFTSIFPSLEEIRIRACDTVSKIEQGFEDDRKFIVEKIRKKEGKELRVVFQDE